ncbi:MAG: radical SAM family heme chaperone HemW [Oligoflexia bacterium]|nr:radical SAM family heme chaperone HemW [Oligoflexia bacterium]
MLRPISIYVHIPYCFHKCPYCDFNAYAVSAIPEKEYVSALLSELDYRASLKEWRARTVQSIYFGGGTPSLFQPTAIRKVVAAICQLFAVHDNVEISLESNPGTLTPDNILGYREAGVNRLSIGAQSFQRRVLAALGRMHSPDHIEAAVEAAKSAGLSNVNIDLIYGAPDETIKEWESDLQAALALEPVHISAYGLTVEKGTPFYLSYRKGQLKLPSEDHVIEMMNLVNSLLPAHGLQRYEISNFAVIGREARHNLAYWNGDDYLGIGAGAHSFNRIAAQKPDSFGTRWSNAALPAKYIEEAVAHGQAESWHDELSFESAVFEFFFLGLRKIAGISVKAFEQRFGVTVETLYPNLLEVLSSEGLIKRSNDNIALSERGLLLADSVIENFAHPEKKVRVERPTVTIEVPEPSFIQTRSLE